MSQAGADIGGTWVRVAVRKGRRILSAKRKSDPEPLAVLRGILADWNIKPGSLIVGARGAWKSAPRAAMKRALAGTAKRIFVLSDVELAHLTAFPGGKPYAAGVLLIAGTGSSALAVDGKGRRRKAGGLAPGSGDPGSARWLAKRWRREAGPQDAPRALSSRMGNRLARDAARALARLAREAAKNLAWTGRIPVACHGGVFNDPRILRALSSELGSGYRLRRSLRRAELRASVLELRHEDRSRLRPRRLPS